MAPGVQSYSKERRAMLDFASMSYVLAGLLSVSIMEGYRLITGREMFPARVPPKWLRRLSRIVRRERD